MRLTRFASVPLALLAACRYAPSVDGASLLECKVDDDCPREGKCEGGTCIPRPFAIDVSVREFEVEAGSACEFVAETNYGGNPGDLTITWQQMLGPTASLSAATGHEISLLTRENQGATYHVEATATAPGLEPVTARRACRAVVTSWVVDGMGGDCTRDDPCGSLDTVVAGRPDTTRVYLGVPAPGERAVYDVDLDPMPIEGLQIYGGYGYPGWEWDFEQYETVLHGTSSTSVELRVNCPVGDCAVRGVTVEAAPSEDLHRAIQVMGPRVTLQHVRVLLQEGAIPSNPFFVGIDIDETAVDALLQNVTVYTEPSAVLWPGGWTGILINGPGVELRQTTVDLTARDASEKFGIDVDVDAARELSPVFDRVRAYAGAATGTTGVGSASRSFALDVDCGLPVLTRSVLSARGAAIRNAAVSIVRDCDSGEWPLGIRAHNTTFVAGGSPSPLHTENTVSKGIEHDTTTAAETLLRNCLIDAGDGMERFGLTLRDGIDALDPDTGGNVIAFQGGPDSDDAPADYDYRATSLPELEALIGCPDCFSIAFGAGFFDRDLREYQLTSASTCCHASALRIDPSKGDPTHDARGRPFADPPSVGAYQYEP